MRRVRLMRFTVFICIFCKVFQRQMILQFLFCYRNWLCEEDPLYKFREVLCKRQTNRNWAHDVRNIHTRRRSHSDCRLTSWRDADLVWYWLCTITLRSTLTTGAWSCKYIPKYVNVALHKRLRCYVQHSKNAAFLYIWFNMRCLPWWFCGRLRCEPTIES